MNRIKATRIFLLANGVYFISFIIKKTPLCFGNKPIMELITKMGAAYAFEPGPCITLLLVLVKHCSMQNLCYWNQLIQKEDKCILVLGLSAS